MRYVIVVTAVMSIVLGRPAFADCQSDIDELKAQIDDEKASYTREARAEARSPLKLSATRSTAQEPAAGQTAP